jgi:hypothetical protein
MKPTIKAITLILSALVLTGLECHAMGIAPISQMDLQGTDTEVGHVSNAIHLTLKRDLQLSHEVLPLKDDSSEASSSCFIKSSVNNQFFKQGTAFVVELNSITPQKYGKKTYKFYTSPGVAYRQVDKYIAAQYNFSLKADDASVDLVCFGRGKELEYTDSTSSYSNWNWFITATNDRSAPGLGIIEMKRLVDNYFDLSTGARSGAQTHRL